MKNKLEITIALVLIILISPYLIIAQEAESSNDCSLPVTQNENKTKQSATITGKSETAEKSSEWQRVDFYGFYICLPKDFKIVEHLQIYDTDGNTKTYKSEMARLDISNWSTARGAFSDVPEDFKSKPTYVLKKISVAGSTYSMMRASENPYIKSDGYKYLASSLIRFKELKPNIFISLIFKCNDEKYDAIAEKIFTSIKLIEKNKVKK